MKQNRTRNHPDDRNAKRKAAICKAFQGGKAPGEIAAEMAIPREVVVGIIARAGLSRGDTPSAPRRFSFETPAKLTLLPPDL